jgi:tetratricopeptide (TPR) repeat protein
MAHACCLSGRYERAVSLAGRLLDFGVQANDTNAQAAAQMLMGDAYYGMGRFRDAAGALDQALPVFRSRYGLRRYALRLLRQGYVHQAMGSAEAAGYLAESLRIFQELNLPRRVEEARQALGRLGPGRLAGTPLPGLMPSQPGR